RRPSRDAAVVRPLVAATGQWVVVVVLAVVVVVAPLAVVVVAPFVVVDVEDLAWSFAHVRGPTIPSAGGAFLCWNVWTGGPVRARARPPAAAGSPGRATAVGISSPPDRESRRRRWPPGLATPPPAAAVGPPPVALVAV